MPLYEYVCDKCETRFDALRPASRMDDPAPCPAGHPRARRVLSTFVMARGGESLPEAESFGGGGCGGGCTNCACGSN